MVIWIAPGSDETVTYEWAARTLKKGPDGTACLKACSVAAAGEERPCLQHQLGWGLLWLVIA